MEKEACGDVDEGDWYSRAEELVATPAISIDLAGKIERTRLTLHLEKNWILEEFPKNYRLYEHIKANVTTTGEVQKSAQSHAKGENDRQDAYVYGHPAGPKKRYRSPKDFFEHVYWLATSKDHDHDDCTCKICSPEEYEDLLAEEARLIKAGQLPPWGWAAPPTASKSRSPTTGSKRTASGDAANPNPSSVARPSNPKPAAVPDSTLNSSPLPSFRCVEQEVDSRYGYFLFRPGELVWFNRGASAWGLAVIIRRQAYQNSPVRTEPRYLVQPLSHPYGHPQATVFVESSLRPWLTWSPPGPTHQALAVEGLTYDAIDWVAVLQGLLGVGDDEVDGSIFAANAIDQSYTLFQQITGPNKLSNASNTAKESHWNGIFLGAEKIWVGEAIRLRMGNRSPMMIVHDIVERSASDLSGSTTNNNNNNTTEVYVVGDVYILTTSAIMMDHRGNAVNIPTTNSNVNLPARVQKDLEFRNEKMRKVIPKVSHWKLLEPRRRVHLGEIRGRWYESSIILPMLRGQGKFNEDVERGEVGDAGIWMNGRYDSASLSIGTSNSSGSGGPTDRIGNKKITREAALGGAVPAHTCIDLGIDNDQRNGAASGVTATTAVTMPTQRQTTTMMAGAGGNESTRGQGTGGSSITDPIVLDTGSQQSSATIMDDTNNTAGGGGGEAMTDIDQYMNLE